MQTYSFYLVGPGGDRETDPAATLECANDAEALAAGCRTLRRAPGSDAIEIWREATKLFRLGGGRGRGGDRHYLGRWDRAWAR